MVRRCSIAMCLYGFKVYPFDGDRRTGKILLELRQVRRRSRRPWLGGRDEISESRVREGGPLRRAIPCHLLRHLHRPTGPDADRHLRAASGFDATRFPANACLSGGTRPAAVRRWRRGRIFHALDEPCRHDARPRQPSTPNAVLDLTVGPMPRPAKRGRARCSRTRARNRLAGPFSMIFRPPNRGKCPPAERPSGWMGGPGEHTA